VYGNHRVIYNTGFRDKGSPYHGGSGDITATTPQDEPLLGSERVSPRRATAVRRPPASAANSLPGLPSNSASYLHAHYMRLYFNGPFFRPDIMEDLGNRVTTTRTLVPHGDEGTLQGAVWFEFNDDNQGFNSTWATIQRFTTVGGSTNSLATAGAGSGARTTATQTTTPSSSTWSAPSTTRRPATSVAS
jgi:hypothetical protein